MSVKIETNGGLSVNIADVKCFRIPIKEGSKNVMIVEFKTRYNYIKNPTSGDYEKQEYNESTEVEFDTYSDAAVYRDEWVVEWKNYLSNRE